MPRKRTGPPKQIRRKPAEVIAAIVAAMVDGKPRQILELRDALQMKRETLNHYLQQMAEAKRVHRRGLGRLSTWHLGPAPPDYVARRVTAPPGGRRHEGPRTTVSSWVGRDRDGFTSSMGRHFVEQTEHGDNIRNYDPEHARPVGRPRKGEVEMLEEID